MSSVNVRSRLRSSAIALGGGVLVALTVSACGVQYVSRGAELYGDGRYVEAEEIFERSEARLADSSASDRARFGLYRGATFLKLGDAVHAARWLGYARSVVTSDPSALGEDETALLEASLKTLASAKTPPERKPDAAVATAPEGPNEAPAQ